jgi:cytochrome oxidase Cu insertion factor (SCO1/SenC/PrrC family)
MIRTILTAACFAICLFSIFHDGARAHDSGATLSKYPPLPFASDYGGPFELTDYTGKTVTERQYYGEYAVLYFGYTGCADTCPVALNAIGIALRNMGALGERITPLFVNLDPEHRSLKELEQYVHLFNPRFVGLTGTTEQLRIAAAAYGIRYRRARNQNGELNIVHSGKIFLLGPDGEVIEYYPHEAPVEWLVTSITHHMEKGSATESSGQ